MDGPRIKSRMVLQDLYIQANIAQGKRHQEPGPIPTACPSLLPFASQQCYRTSHNLSILIERRNDDTKRDFLQTVHNINNGGPTSLFTRRPHDRSRRRNGHACFHSYHHQRLRVGARGTLCLAFHTRCHNR